MITALAHHVSAEARTVNSHHLVEHLADVHGITLELKPSEAITQKKDVRRNEPVRVIVATKTRWLKPGIATVIVLDNASIHISKAVQERLPLWQALALPASALNQA